MKTRTNVVVILSLTALAAPLWLPPVSVSAQVVIQEDFDGVSGVGGGEFFVGAGEGVLADWDTGLTGESAFAGATVRAFSHASAEGVATAGVNGSGAGVISVTDVTFNPLHLDFQDVSGNPGGGVFMDSSSGAEGFIDNWDNKISGEAAFGGVRDGAVLNGTMSAQAIQGSGYVELDVNGVDVTAGSWYAGLMFAAPALEGAVVLQNPGFDDNAALAPWTPWGNVFSEPAANVPVTPLSGTQVLKMFGTFTGAPNTSGVYQELPAQAGQVWELDAFSQHVATDSISGTQNFVEMRIEFYDGVNPAPIGTNGAVILNGSSATNVWFDLTPLQATAPAGTTAARAVFVFHQPAVGLFEGGAGLVDDVTFQVVAGPPQSAVDLSAISLTADVRGTVDGIGETLGAYQLRIEDAEGDRLVFFGTADGNWQSVGGPLSGAIEVSSNGVTTNGVFNTLSSTFTIVVTFDNDTTVTWGTGGTLEVDNVILTGSDPLNSEWHAGLFWDNLAVPTADLSRLLLKADVQGDVAGGDYVLRVEGFITNSNGIDEAFTDVSGAGGQVILDYDMNTSGIFAGWSNDWDAGITGEAAFGGISSGSLFCSEAQCPGTPDVGITAKGVISGGNPGGYGEIKVTGIWQLAPGGNWYGGLMWLGQGLASTDLSQVRLEADVKGFADFLFGEQLGSIELRIEDEQGDRLYVRTNATTSWQRIGGTLDTFTEAGRAGGGGDGTFNLDSVNYTVVVAFDDPWATWVWGGTIQVDNVFLTPADVQVEIGRVSFAAVADGSYQSVGGLLSDGASTFATDLDDDFEGANGGSAPFWQGPTGALGGADWDSGLSDEAYFAGTWGGGTLGPVTVQTCDTCGFGGTKAVEFLVTNPTGSRWTGGWWAGLAWENQHLDITDLSQIALTARIKGVAAPGGQQGTVSFKLEDPNLDAMEFLVVTDGTWQSVGGALSTATMVASGNTSQGSDGIFDVNAPWYKVVIVTWGPTPTGTPGVDPDWNSSHTITVDDLFLTRPGRAFGDAETYTVTLAFENEMATWGTAGTLALDNLAFVITADQDGDHDVDLMDFAAFQSCFTGSGGSVGGTCGSADMDGDGDVDLADYDWFAQTLSGP